MANQTFTYRQLEDLWIRNGGSRVTAPVAAAVAMAESSGRSWVTSPNPDGGVNVGPWQLDTRGKGAGYTVAQLQDPDTNARVAIAGSSGGRDWSAWETYVTGAWKQFYQGKGSPPPGGGGGTQQASDFAVWDPTAPGGLLWQITNSVQTLWNALGDIGSGTDPLTQLARAFTVMLAAFEWFFVPDHWLRIIAAGFGILLGIPGLYALVKTGSGGTYGDVSLALGILLVTLSGMCFFIAFHNLPQDVTNLQSLLGWMSEGIRSGHARGAAAK